MLEGCLLVDAKISVLDLDSTGTSVWGDATFVLMRRSAGETIESVVLLSVAVLRSRKPVLENAVSPPNCGLLALSSIFFVQATCLQFVLLCVRSDQSP